MVDEIISGIVTMAVIIGVIVGALLLRGRGTASTVIKAKCVLAIITATIMAIVAAGCLYFAVKYLIDGSKKTTACVLFCAAAGALMLALSMVFDVFTKSEKPRLILAICFALLTAVCVGVAIWLLTARLIAVASVAIGMVMLCGTLSYRECKLYIRLKHGRQGRQKAGASAPVTKTL